MSSAKAMLGGLLGRFIFRAAQVTEVSRPAPGFRHISFAGDALRGATWEPGDKLQVFLPEVGTRAYTPLFWDPDAGRTALLVYVHGDSPGAAWARDLASGAAVQLFGPRRSLSANHARSIVVFGDETSIGLSYALRTTRPERQVTTVLEVSRPADSDDVLRALGLEATLVQRAEADAHLGAVAGHLRAALQAQRDPLLVMTGRARAIQSVKRELRATATTKAYWALGKVGLD
jgi:ferric-chelate reductase (NADPH)